MQTCINGVAKGHLSCCNRSPFTLRKVTFHMVKCHGLYSTEMAGLFLVTVCLAIWDGILHSVFGMDFVVCYGRNIMTNK